MVQNFSFIIPSKLAGSAIPGYWQNNLEEELCHLKDKGIIGIISLTEWTLDRNTVTRSGITHYCHLPVPDFGTPTLEQIDQMVQFVDSIISKNEGAILIHCFAGQGRTGMMLAAYLVAKGMTAQEAIETIRKKRPGSIETANQEKRLHLFAEQYQEKKNKEKEKLNDNSNTQGLNTQQSPPEKEQARQLPVRTT